MAVLVDAIQWTYTQKKDGTSPIKLRVQYKSESKYFPILYKGKSLSLTKPDWEEMTSTRVKMAKRKILERVREEESRGREIVEKITMKGKRPFSYGRFSAEYDQSNNDSSFCEIFGNYLESLKTETRIGSYNAYNNARVAFKDFLATQKKKDIQVHEITPPLLSEFEGYLLRERKVGKKKKREVGKNTVAIYMRSLKVIYNLAMLENPGLGEFYPFARKKNDKSKYHIRTVSGKKGDALSVEQLQTFAALKPDVGSASREAQQFWLFSLYCQGMNFRDMAYLKPRQNMKETSIVYTRRKTMNSEHDETSITIPLSDSIRQILRDLGCNLLDERYPVFPILKSDLTPEKEDAVIKQKIKVTNKWLRKLCKENGLPEITTYWARHTYASLLKGDGVSIDMIRELLGHSSSKTTETYLRRFDIEKIRNINERIQKMSLGS